MVLRRLFAWILSVILLLPALAFAASGEPDITTLGGDRFRNHHYRSVMPSALCLQRNVPIGWSLSQPLIIRFPKDVFAHEEVVFHLGETHLFVLTLDGELLASHWVQPGFSWGSMTYAKRGPDADPEQDVLYVAYGDNGTPRKPGVKAYKVADVLHPPTSTPTGAGGPGATPLGAVGLTGMGIASAPLFMGYDERGVDRIVVSIVPDILLIIKNLTMSRGDVGQVEIIYKQLEGWNSGTATMISEGAFAVVAGYQRLRDGSTRKGGIFFYYVEGRDADGVWRRDFEPAHPQREFQNHGLTQIVLDRNEPLTLFATEQDGRVYRIDMGYDVKDMLPVPGFSNTGPSMSADTIYAALRWENNSTSTQTAETSAYGRLIGIDKATWQPWTRPLTPEPGAPPWPRSWVNVTPLIWESTTDPARETILIGDAGGSLSAWTHAGEPEPLFLTQGLAPLRCDQIETLGERPAFVRSPRTQLTATPHTTSGADAWHNTQGAATEMSVYAGRLLAGYNNAAPHGESSSLVIFRPATNLAMGALTVQTESGPITRETILRPGQQVQVDVPLYLEADPLRGPQPFPVAVGWETGRPVVRTVLLTPFAPHVERITLTVPANAEGLRLMAVANPALYEARREAEVAQSLVPPVLAGALPATVSPVPAGWQADWDAPALGEAWVLDNARTWSQPYQCDLRLRIDSPAAGADVARGVFPATVTVIRVGCGGLEAVPVEVDGLRQLARFAQGEPEVKLRFEVFAETCGPLIFAATVDPSDRVGELDETNNRAERSVAVGGCQPIQTECPPQVSPAQCRGSKPTSHAAPVTIHAPVLA